METNRVHEETGSEEILRKRAEIDEEPMPEVEPQEEAEPELRETGAEMVAMRTAEILHILANFAEMKEEGVTKVEYVTELRKLFCRGFHYSEELMEYLMRLFNAHECFNFLEAMDEKRPVTIRVNTLKTKRKELAQTLADKNVGLEPLDEISKVCLKVNKSKVPIGATTEYLAGHYMLQSAASLLPVMALAPQPGDKVLDMAAAPGGKTTHIAQILKNTGLIVANDFKKERTRALHFNCQRMGIQNVIVTNYDGRKFPDCLKNFDRILLDAPCTGLGIISRDQSIKASRTMRDVFRAAHLQKELLRSAIDRCKVGGYVVYSTCSIAVEENEEVVDYITKQRHVKIVDTGLNIESKVYPKFGEKRFHDRIKYCVRVFPHSHNLDGFFICKLKKLKDGDKTVEYRERNDVQPVKKVAKKKFKKTKK
jgi:ribosomal RNA methyltransferase Nop2